MTAALSFAAVLLPGLSAGCGSDAYDALQARETYTIEPLPPESLRLTGAASSLDELLHTVEQALDESDTLRLFDLMVTMEEYRRILYPAFPAAHPPIGADFATIWVNHYPDSYRGLKHLMRRFGGREVRIFDIRFDHPHQDFVNFVLHETSRVDIETDGAREDNVRLFGSVFRVGDQWKVLSYPDE
ncbi:MAG TPA: hypothetical protein VM737_01000 [Gemmatimonadota bacterium]|nr:hypothetical protein [Gemmatimonadota bacterium]